MSLGDGASDAVGFGPRVFGKRELIMVNGENGFGFKVEDCLLQTFRRGVDIFSVAESYCEQAKR